MKRGFLLFGLLGAFVFWLGSCGKIASTTGQTGSIGATESGLQALDSALNDVEANATVALEPRTACSTTRFDPAIGSPNCDASGDSTTVIANFDGCTDGLFAYNGSTTLSFSTSSSCTTWIGGTLPTDGSTVTRTSTNFVTLGPGGTSVLTSSTAAANYLGNSIGGGVVTTLGSTRIVAIPGLQRVETLASSANGFDHSIHTSSSLSATGTRAASSRQISSGTFIVDDNIDDLTVSANVTTTLTYSSSCCYPTGGVLTSTVTSTSEATTLFVMTFTSTCGAVQILDSGETLPTDATLDSCT